MARTYKGLNRGSGGNFSNGPQITELGNPDFSPSDSSQGQVPGAAAQQSQFSNQKSAASTLLRAQSLGYDVSGSDFDPIRQQAETGFAENAGTVLGTMVGWIDGPRQAINLLIQDMVGGEAPEGFENPNFGDYWNTLWGGVEDPDGFEAHTGLNPISGSQTLDMFGWAEEDDLAGRIARGAADFGLQVLSDPLTYVTFGLSGLGKKVALSVGRQFQSTTIKNITGLARKLPQNPKQYGTALDEAVHTGIGLSPYERQLAANWEQAAVELQDDIARLAQKTGGEIPPDMKEALNNLLGYVPNSMDLDDALEAALANRIHKDVIRPLVGRDFKNVNKLALENLPAFASGGARISVPFVAGQLNTSKAGKIPQALTLQKGLLIPGTAGLGRKLVGDPMRHLFDGLSQYKGFGSSITGGVSNVVQSVGKGATKMDQMAPLLRGLRNGDIEGWQWHIAASAIDSMQNNAAKHTIATDLNAQWNAITQAAADEGIDNLHEISSEVLWRLESSDIDEVLLREIRTKREGVASEGLQPVFSESFPTGTELGDRMTKMVTSMQETMDSYHDALSVMNPEFKDRFIRGYIPHTPTKSGRALITAFAGHSSGKAGKGNTADDVWAHLLNAAGNGGVAAPEMGSTRHIGRKVGRLQALQIKDDGIVMLDEAVLKALRAQDMVDNPLGPDGMINPTTMQTSYLSVKQLNEMLAPIIEREADRLGIVLPKDWDGIIFNDNPVETMLDYVDSMTDAINSWNVVNRLKASGLAFTHRAELDMQQVAQNMYSNAVRNASEVPISHFGTPTEDAVEIAPVSFLKTIMNSSDARTARENIKPGGSHEGLGAELVKDGVETPVKIEMWEDGSVQIVNGHHRILAAEAQGLSELPVQVVPETGHAAKPKNGVTVRGKMKEEWWTFAKAEMDATVAEGDPIVNAGLISGDGGPVWDIHEAFNVTPWGAERTELNLLHGGPNQSHLPGVPANVHDDLVHKGFAVNDLEDVADGRALANNVASTHPEQWMDPVPVQRGNLFPADEVPPARSPGNDWTTEKTGNTTRHTFAETKGEKGVRGLKAKRVAAAEIEQGTEALPTRIRLAIAPGLGKGGRANARKALIEFLDRAFREGGELSGMFTDRGIRQLIEGGMDRETSEILHRFASDKLGTLSRDAKEFISKEPAEVFEARLLYDNWAKGYNDLIARVTGARTSNGTLISEAEAIELYGTAETVKQLQGLKRAALTLGEKGYDQAAAVMRDVDAYAGVADITGFVNPAHFNLAGPAVDDLTMQTDIAEWLSLTANNMGSIYTPEGIAAAKLAAKESLRWWRAMATLPRPAFHIRNLVGGSWMNLAAGVTSKSMSEVSHHGVVFRNALRNAAGTDGMDAAFDALPAGRIREGWRQAWENNVMAGFATTEFTGKLTPAGMRERWDWAKAWDVDNFALTRAGGRVMESVEDFLRMSLFMEYFDETVEGSAKTAADMVNAIHFDYSNLTPTETKMKSIIPFFVWSRRNIPLQIQMAVENPRYVQRYRAMMQSMDENLGGEDPENLQEADHFTAWAAGTNYRVNADTPFWARIMIDPDLPIADLLDLPNPTPDELINFADGLLGPHISLLGDLGKQREFGDVNAPAPFNLSMQGLAAVGLYDKTTDGDVRMPYLMRTLLETGVPFSREIFDPLTGGPTAPNRQQRLGITEEDGFLESSAKSMAAQIMGGLGVKMTTPADVRGAAYRSDQDIDQLIKELRLQGRLPPVER